MKFDAKKTTEEIIAFIREYYEESNMSGAVIGISGGKDSAVCLALMKEAIGSENILALWLPANSKKTDKEDAILLCKTFNVPLEEFDLEKYSTRFIKDMKKKNKVNDSDLSDVLINLKPRLRMLTLYSYAAMMSKIKKKGYLVIGTSNKSERFVGYFTKGGDSVCDIAPIADMYVDEVIEIGKYLKVPEEILHKTPDDGLSNLSDEEKLGFTYCDVKIVAEEYEADNIIGNIDRKTKEKILNKHQKNLHKFYTPVYKRKD